MFKQLLETIRASRRLEPTVRRLSRFIESRTGVSVPLLAPPPPYIPNRPNYRRRQAVFAALDRAWETYGYRSVTDLQKLVKQDTGKGCSRRLVCEWRREQGKTDKRRDAVYRHLDKARASGLRSYAELREFVRKHSGTGCGSELILAWKKSRGIEINKRVRNVDSENISVVCSDSGDGTWPIPPHLRSAAPSAKGA
ncbi:MAG: hypothetical protein AB4050_18700 [Synechococcus sp.]